MSEHDQVMNDDEGLQAADEEDKLTFEQAFARLEQVVRRLEGEEVSLNESLKLFEQGVMLSRICASRLDAAEGKMRLLLEGAEEAKEVQFDPATGELT